MSQENENQGKKSNHLIVNTLNNLFADHRKHQQKQAAQSRGANPEVSKHDLEVALTTVLVDLAVSDQNFEPSEYTVIQKSLQSLFGTPKTEVSKLVNQAVSRLKNLRGCSTELKLLKENLTDDQKQMVVTAIDSVIDADKSEDGFEVYMRAKFVDLLGVSKN